MTIFATSVTGTGSATAVVDTAGTHWPVPPEGLSVVPASALAVAGTTFPAGPEQVVVFQQPAVSAALDVEIVAGVTDSLPAGTAATIHAARNA